MRAVAFLVLLLGAVVLPSILAAVTIKDENKWGAEEENNQVVDAKKYCGKCCGGWYRGQCSRCCSPEEEANLVNTDAKPQKLDAEKETNQAGGDAKYQCKKCCGGWYRGQCRRCCSPEEETNLMNSEANPENLEQSNYRGRKVSVGGSERKP